MENKKNSSGFTLIELLVGLAIFGIAVLPLILFQARTGNLERTKDLYTAAAILSGEIDVMYENGKLPPGKKHVEIDGRDYTIVTEYSLDSVLATWSMSVEKGERTISNIKGLLYRPVN